MMISLGRTQMIISNLLLLAMILSVFLCLVILSRAKNESSSFFSIISSDYDELKQHCRSMNTRYRKTYALLSQDGDDDDDEVENEVVNQERDTGFDDVENGRLSAPRPSRNSQDLKCSNL